MRAVGHRLTDDGALFGGPVRVDAAVLERLAALAGARRRERMVLATLRSLARRRPELPQVACFETAFHARMPTLARLFDRRTRRRQLHSYRHGLTYEALMEQLAAVDDRAVRGRTIAVLLDQSIALCAVLAGRSVAATPAFDAGPPGKGRAPGRGRPFPPAATRFALYRVRRDMGSLAAAMGGVDAVAFATGGERRAAALRPRILGDATWLGVESDPAAAGGARLTRPRSRVAAWLVHPDPTRVIARHTLKAVGG